MPPPKDALQSSASRSRSVRRSPSRRRSRSKSRYDKDIAEKKKEEKTNEKEPQEGGKERPRSPTLPPQGAARKSRAGGAVRNRRRDGAEGTVTCGHCYRVIKDSDHSKKAHRASLHCRTWRNWNSGEFRTWNAAKDAAQAAVDAENEDTSPAASARPVSPKQTPRRSTRRQDLSPARDTRRREEASRRFAPAERRRERRHRDSRSRGRTRSLSRSRGKRETGGSDGRSRSDGQRSRATRRREPEDCLGQRDKDKKEKRQQVASKESAKHSGRSQHKSAASTARPAAGHLPTPKKDKGQKPKDKKEPEESEYESLYEYEYESYTSPEKDSKVVDAKKKTAAVTASAAVAAAKPKATPAPRTTAPKGVKDSTPSQTVPGTTPTEGDKSALYNSLLRTAFEAVSKM